MAVNQGIDQFKCLGVTLYGSGQLWSNTSLRTDDRGILAIMTRASFLDILKLACRKSITELRTANDLLLTDGLIGTYQHNENEHWLWSIEQARRAR